MKFLKTIFIIFILVILCAIAFSNCTQFENTDVENTDDTALNVDIGSIINGAFLLAGQSNMEGHVDETTFGDIVYCTRTLNNVVMPSCIENSVKNWYYTYNNGYAKDAFSEPINTYQANEIVRLKNENIVGNFRFRPARISQLETEEITSKTVYILDSIGGLKNYYAASSFCFVGGSLVAAGGHNILEPAAFQKPIIFGKYMHNFSDIRECYFEMQFVKNWQIDINHLTNILNKWTGCNNQAFG